MNIIEEQYKSDELKFAEIIQKHNGLTKEAKEEIADVIIDKIYWGANDSFFGNFLDITALEIVKRWATYNSIRWSTEELKTDDCKLIKEEVVLKGKMEEFCSIYSSNPKEQIKKTILDWIDDEMFKKQ